MTPCHPDPASGTPIGAPRLRARTAPRRELLLVTVLDASALLASLQGEPGADLVEDRLVEGASAWGSDDRITQIR